MLKLFRRTRSASEDLTPNLASPGEGRRVYAIGDVHGRRDLLGDLMNSIIADYSARPPVREFRLILLGDLIDRGPDSAGVLDMVIAMAERWPDMECLMGNHEEIFLMALRGDPRALNLFRNLGRETLLSYGIDEALIDSDEDGALHSAMLEQVPERHRDFLAARPDNIILGDYCFVHAGIRPGIPIEEQDGQDMRWIRREFLKSRVQHSHVIVHGHSITESADVQPCRIGIDTGAYASDRLTAVGLEGTERWFLTT